MTTTFHDYAQGVHNNTILALAANPQYVETLQTVNASFEGLLEHLGGSGEGAALFAGMAHGSFLAAINLATSGQLPPAYMVARGVTEAALYCHYLFHHPQLKKVWGAQHQSEEAKSKVRKEFTIRKMRDFLKTKSQVLAEQFSIVYGATIDLGAHPNSLGAFSHLVDDSDGNYVWQYINIGGVDQRFALRVVAMSGIFALNIFQELFPVHFASTPAGALLSEAHVRFDALPELSESGG